jgi:carboxyl-terminal processing protease
MKRLNNVINAAVIIIFLMITNVACNAQQQVDVQTFEQALNKNDIVLIDVRTPEEFNAGYIAGATNIDINSNTFKQQIKQLSKNKTVLVYCRSGNRSAKASKILRKNHYKVMDLAGGINAWIQSGKKLVQ